MRSSAILSVCLAGLAMGGPIVKKALVTEVVTAYVYVYAAETPEPTATPPPAVLVPTPAAAPTVAPVIVAPVPVDTAPAVVAAQPSVPPPVVAPVAPVAPVVAPVAPVVAPVAPVVAPVATPEPVVKGGVAGLAIPDPSDFKANALYYHNVHRANHSADAVTYDDALAAAALVLASSCDWGHDTTIGGGGYGQNIAQQGTSPPPTSSTSNIPSLANHISNFWYNGELALFPAGDYGKDNPDTSNFHAWGHYTQVVWKGTKKIGCATAFCPSGKGKAVDSSGRHSGGPMFTGNWAGFYTVCNYSPAGNMGGAYGTNVGKPLGLAGVTVL